MILSENTLHLLKNFAGIQPNIVFNKGSVIKTMAEAKNIVGIATIEEEFPVQFGIYDLNEFLGVLSLNDNSELKFEKDHVLIKSTSGRSRIKYYYSDVEMLTHPTKDIKMPLTEVSFVLDHDTLIKIKRAASTLALEEVAITGKNNVLTLSVIDQDNATSNTFSIDIAGKFEEEKFKFIFNINNLKMISGDYEVNISQKLISNFINKSTATEYIIAVEKNSTFG